MSADERMMTAEQLKGRIYALQNRLHVRTLPFPSGAATVPLPNFAPWALLAPSLTPLPPRRAPSAVPQSLRGTEGKFEAALRRHPVETVMGSLQRQAEAAFPEAAAVSHAPAAANGNASPPLADSSVPAGALRVRFDARARLHPRLRPWLSHS